MFGSSFDQVQKKDKIFETGYAIAIVLHIVQFPGNASLGQQLAQLIILIEMGAYMWSRFDLNEPVLNHDTQGNMKLRLWLMYVIGNYKKCIQ